MYRKPLVFIKVKSGCIHVKKNFGVGKRGISISIPLRHCDHRAQHELESIKELLSFIGEDTGQVYYFGVYISETWSL